VLLDGGLARLEKAFRLSDRAMASVRENLGIIIVPNAIAIALGALGRITPPIAATINNGATALAVLAGTIPLIRTPAWRPRPVEGRPERAPAPAIVPRPSIGTPRRPPRVLAAGSGGRG